MSKILQLSDPHIVPEGELAYGVVDTATALRRTVSTINRCLPLIGPVDLAIVTGDLTDFGSHDEYARFQEIMAALHVPYQVVPGNHDLRENLRTAFLNEPWMPSSGGVNWIVELPDFAVICLDTLVEGYHHGVLLPETLDFLQASLHQLSGKPVLLGMHHPPFDTGIRPMDVNNLWEAERLQAILDPYSGEVRLACGHVHRSMTRMFGKSIAMIVPGTSHSVTLDQRDENPHTLSLESGGFVLHEWRDGFVSHVIAADFPADRFPFNTPKSGDRSIS